MSTVRLLVAVSAPFLLNPGHGSTCALYARGVPSYLCHTSRSLHVAKTRRRQVTAAVEFELFLQAETR